MAFSCTTYPIACDWYKDDAGFNNPSFRSPVQNVATLTNCSFMAALSSIAWVTNKINPNQQPSKVVNNIRYWNIIFYYPSAAYEVPEQFWLDPNVPPYNLYGHSN